MYVTEGVPSPKFQVHVFAPALASVKFSVKGDTPVVGSAVKAAVMVPCATLTVDVL